MNVVVKASLILAGAVAVLTAVVYATGFYKNFMASQWTFIIAAIVINAGAVFWALRQTADENAYGAQLLNAAGIGLLGGVLVAIVSWALLAVVFPHVLGEWREAAIAYMDGAGMPQEQYDAQMASLDAATPMSQSIPGGIATFVTSLVSGAVIAIFQRRK